MAWTTALALEYAMRAPLSFDVSPMNLWGEKGIPLYTHPGGQGHESSRSQSEDSSARESVADAPASPGPMVSVPRDRIEGLLEYWNGNPNERAMLDALAHIQTELQAMLAVTDKERSRG